MKTRLALLLPLLALAGCADNNASVRVSAICAPPDDAKACTFAATCGAQYIGQNVLDVAPATPYYELQVQVDNQTAKNDNSGAFRTNTADAFVQETEVEYLGVPLPTQRGPVLGSATVPAGGTAVISVVPIDTTNGATLKAAVGAGGYVDLVAKMRLRGVFADTTAFETGVYEVPIRVCNGCTTVPPCTTAGEVSYPCPKAGQTPASYTCAKP